MTSPYVGLRAYRAEEHELFFGRAKESRDIATIWQATGLTLVYGASGVGKTSLIEAGVLPRIPADRADALPVARMSPRWTAAHRDGSGNPYVRGLLAAWSADAPGAPATLTEFFAGHPVRYDRYGDPVPTLVAVDQAEELFSGPVQLEEQRRAVLDELVAVMAAHDGVRLLLSLREEHLAAVLPYERRLGLGSRARYRLLPLSPAAALDAITKPLATTGRTFTGDAADTLLASLRAVTIVDDEGRATRLETDTVEPVQLQVVCAALWDSLPPSLTEITPDHVRLHADIDRFLAGFCRRAVGEVAAEHGLTGQEILRWMRTMLVTEHGTRNAVYEGLRTTAGLPNAVVRALEDRHLLRAEQRLGVRWYELQHDRLIVAVQDPDPPEALLTAAERALDRGDLEGAARLAGAAIRASDQEWVRAAATAVLGRVAGGRGETELALQRFDAAKQVFAKLGLAERLGWVLVEEGRLWLGGRDYEAAVTVLRTAVLRAPQNAAARILLARALWEAGQPGTARFVLNGALTLPGMPSPEALALLGEILVDLGEHEEAVRRLERAHGSRVPVPVGAWVDPCRPG